MRHIKGGRKAMRYGSEHKQQTRERVLKEAARAIRVSGPHQVGVAEVMAKAGLTHGGFYAHFKSREDLVAAAVDRMFQDSGAALALGDRERPPQEVLGGYIDFYLSPRHRDTRNGGCPLPYLAADAPRLPGPVRERFASGVARLRDMLLDQLTRLGVSAPDQEAGSMLAELVGALSLARAEPEPALSDAILATSKTALKRRYKLELAS